MKIVISIPDYSYDYIKGLERGYHDYATNCMLYHSVKNAVPYEERPQGEWIHPYKSDIACECSNCHRQMPITDYYNFCPNCGADMRGKDNG